MISIEITNGAGQVRTFTDELIGFTWSTRNNEEASFSASIPSLVASIVVTNTDGFVASLTREARVSVTSTVDNSLTLKLSVIGVMPLDKKGKAEISCTGNFFTQSNNIFGTLYIPQQSDWSITQANYGLSMVEMHEPNNQVLINVQKKDDIALGIAWGFSTRRNISRTPFTATGGNFNQDGIGIFKDIKPSQTDTYAPVYKLTADQIIDYEIAPAQPPVTHLRTTTLGELGPTPQIPPIALLKYSSSPLTKNVRQFCVEEAQLTAVYTAQEDADGNIVDQSLVWSDNVTITWQGSTVVKVIGIFTDAYIIVSDSSHVQVIDRATGAVRKEFLHPNADELYTELPARVSNFLPLNKFAVTSRLAPDDTYQDNDPCQIFWLPKLTDRNYYGIVYYERLGQYAKVSGDSIVTSGLYFVSTCKVLNPPTAQPAGNVYCVEALYATSDGVSGEKKAIWFYVPRSAILGEYQRGVITLPEFTPENNLVLDGQTLGQVVLVVPLDYIASEATPTTQHPAYVLYLVLAEPFTGTDRIIRPFIFVEYIFNTGSTSYVKARYENYISAKWVTSPSTIAPVYTSTPLLGLKTDAVITTQTIDQKTWTYDDWYLLQDTTGSTGPAGGGA